MIAGRLVGFATVAGGSIERHGLPAAGERFPAYPLPILRLARLGVDRRAQGRGIGLGLLAHVLGVALAQRDTVGCVGVVADAKPGAVAFYERLGFAPLGGVREGQLHGDPTPMFLPIRTIAASAH